MTRKAKFTIILFVMSVILWLLIVGGLIASTVAAIRFASHPGDWIAITWIVGSIPVAAVGGLVCRLASDAISRL